MDVTKSEQKCSLDVSKLIQPDLLSVEELVNILQQRGVGPSLLPQSKDKLVSLFKRVALPLPQRELRQNYRGSLLTKLRKKAERIKLCESPSNQSNTYTVGITGNSTQFSHESKSSGDRLKPPPDFVNHERKKIRLNSTSSSAEKSKHNRTSDLDKIVIKQRKSSENCDNLHIEKDVVVTNEKSGDASTLDRLKIDAPVNASEINKETDTPSKECNGTKSKTAPKKVSLKRNHLFSKTSSSTSENNTEKLTPESDKEPDKKRKPITWPL